MYKTNPLSFFASLRILSRICFRFFVAALLRMTGERVKRVYPTYLLFQPPQGNALRGPLLSARAERRGRKARQREGLFTKPPFSLDPHPPKLAISARQTDARARRLAPLDARRAVRMEMSGSASRCPTCHSDERSDEESGMCCGHRYLARRGRCPHRPACTGPANQVHPAIVFFAQNDNGVGFTGISSPSVILRSDSDEESKASLRQDSSLRSE